VAQVVAAELFGWLEAAAARPKPFSEYTTIQMWDDDHISSQMLACHLDGSSDLASRNSGFISRSTEWMRHRFGIGSSTTILDCGCGPGLYTAQWARMGARVTGIDASRRSVQYAVQRARQDGLSINYLCDDYLKHPFTQRFDLITMIYCDYCVLSPIQRREMHRRWRSMLRPEGRILFDVHSLAYFNTAREFSEFAYHATGFWSSEPHFVFQNVFRYDTEKLLLHKYTVVEGKEIRTFYNWLQCFSRQELETGLARDGLVVEESLANVAGDQICPDSVEFAVVVAGAT
jgi:SAM-dependent methyltransferase